jgi:hypothetical protein
MLSSGSVSRHPWSYSFLLRPSPVVCRTLAISCEAVPASVTGRRGHPAAPPAGNGADGSFVSFIALLGSAPSSRCVRRTRSGRSGHPQNPLCVDQPPAFVKRHRESSPDCAEIAVDPPALNSNEVLRYPLRFGNSDDYRRPARRPVNRTPVGHSTLALRTRERMEPLNATEERGAGILRDPRAVCPFASAPDLKTHNSVGVIARPMGISEKGFQNRQSNLVNVIALPAIRNGGQDRKRGRSSGQASRQSCHRSAPHGPADCLPNTRDQLRRAHDLTTSHDASCRR